MNLTNKISEYFILAISLIAFWGGLVYRLYKLNFIGIIISLILVIISIIIIQLLFSKGNQGKSIKKYFNSGAKNKISHNKFGNFLKFFLPVLYLFLFASCFYLFFVNSTTQAIISPWQVLPNYFFIFFLLASFLLLIIISTSHRLSLFFIILHYFLSFSVAIFIYKIGYGFDPFIHGAAMKLISETGAIDPKPFYYLGQYSLIIILHKLFFLPIVWLNKLLVPVLAAIFLPLSINEALSSWFKNKIKINLTLLFFLILPFSFFIITTPQNLAYFFLLLIIIKGLYCKNMFNLMVIFALSGAALLTHPIAGIPALLFSFMIAVYYSDIKKYKKNLYRIIFIFSAAALPLAFFFLENNIFNTGAGAINSTAGISIPGFSVPGKENFILNFIYLIKNNFLFIFLILIIFGIIIALKHKKECRIFSLYFSMSIAMILAFFLAKNLGFNFLIDYERGNYASRMLNLAILFLFPFYLVSIYVFINNLHKQNKFIKYSFYGFLLALISASLYLSYPRFDNYFNSHGYSVSQSDINAVKWIENNTKNEYIVLANQQVSAASLREFGFKKYYTDKSQISNPKSQIFYYPIPTGGPLYQYYLKMVYEYPAKETVTNAMDLVGVNEAYFVLNKYWWAFPKILEEAKLDADSWHEIENGEIYVFKYIK